MNADELDSMNTLLKGELSAVESYDKALERVQRPNIAELLTQAKDSHAERVARLRDAIVSSGGEPIESPGAWGSFAKLVASTAASMGDSAIVAALEEGEDLGSNEYEWKILNIHGDNRKLVRDELFPKQQATHKLLSTLVMQSSDGSWAPAPARSDG
jgi:uncharacterized protein (TIGR02284 family)